MAATLITERDFLATVIAVAEALGWLTYHTHRSDRSAAGFPDLVLLRPPRIIFAELKITRGHLTSAQAKWLEALHKVPGNEVHLWTPASPDWRERLA